MGSTPKLAIVLGIRPEDFEEYECAKTASAWGVLSEVRCASTDEARLALQQHAHPVLLVCSADAASQLESLARWLEQRGEQVVTWLLYPGAKADDVPPVGFNPVRILSDEQDASAPLTEQKLGYPGEECANRQLLDHLIRGMAHDFNNILAGIMGEVQLAESRNQDERIAPHLERAHQACYRLAGEIRRLLLIEDTAGQRRGMVDLAGIIRGEADGIRAMLPRDTVCMVDAGSEPAWIEAAPASIGYLLQHAVEYGLTELAGCHSARVSLERASAPGLVSQSSHSIRLTLELRAEPDLLSSTTARRSGSEGGICLAVVWKLVNDLGGYLDTAVRRSERVLLHIYLPEAAHATSMGARPLSRLRGSETIALLLHEQAEAHALSRNLVSMGYRAPVYQDASQLLRDVTANTADETLIVVEGRPLDALSRDLHGRLRSALPRVPILLAASEAGRGDIGSIQQDPMTILMRSPIDLKELLVTIRTLRSNAGLFPFHTERMTSG